jgi:NADH:ubiquinone oxidoreductase subunit
MSAINRIFTWWNGATIGTLLDTRRHGRSVGTDEAGNRYYESRDGKRRWVVYDGEAEASRVSPDWHGWLHHTFDAPPTAAPLPRKPWEKPHKPNLTGLPGAYVPPGSAATPTSRPRATGDYQAWSPE